jgi:hypothetical protein
VLLVSACALTTVVLAGCAASGSQRMPYGERADLACAGYIHWLGQSPNATTFQRTLTALERQARGLALLAITMRRLAPAAADRSAANDLAEALAEARGAETAVIRYLHALNPLRRAGMSAIGKVVLPRPIAEPLRKALLRARRAATKLDLGACVNAAS